MPSDLSSMAMHSLYFILPCVTFYFSIVTMQMHRKVKLYQIWKFAAVKVSNDAIWKHFDNLVMTDKLSNNEWLDVSSQRTYFASPLQNNEFLFGVLLELLEKF